VSTLVKVSTVVVLLESEEVVFVLPPQATIDKDNTTATAPNLNAFFIVSCF
jgi:hypothetical protein